MKTVCFAALLLIGYGASAQNNSKLILADTTGERYFTLRNSLLPQSKFSHNTSKGKIYTLPYDHMPCLVPDMDQVARMPQHNMPLGKMPNAVPLQPLIPGEEKEKKNEK